MYPSAFFRCFILNLEVHGELWTKSFIDQSAGAVEYTDYISAEGLFYPTQRVLLIWH